MWAYILDLVQNSTDNLFINICLLLYNSPLDTNKGDNIIYKVYDVKKNNRSWARVLLGGLTIALQREYIT